MGQLHFLMHLTVDCQKYHDLLSRKGPPYFFISFMSIFHTKFNPSKLTAVKSSLTILVKSFRQKQSCEIFEGERTFPTTLLQLFYKIILNSEDIIKSILDADDNLGRKRWHPKGISGISIPLHKNR